MKIANRLSRSLSVSVLLAMVSLFGVAACGAGAHKESAVDDRGFARATVKKGGSGVSVAYRIEGVPQANVPTSITVEFSGVGESGDALASFSAEEPAVLTSAPSLTISSNQTSVANVLVNAPADGVYFVNVTTRQAGRSSVVSIPVKVGAGTPRLERSGTVQTTPSGEHVISLPSK